MTEIDDVTADAVAVLLASLNEDDAGVTHLLTSHDALRVAQIAAFCARFAARTVRNGPSDGARVRATLERAALEMGAR